jgi:hypothetical protein
VGASVVVFAVVVVVVVVVSSAAAADFAGAAIATAVNTVRIILKPLNVNYT